MITIPSGRLAQHWFFRYKLYHIPFWAAYHFMWGIAEFSLSEVITMMFYSPRSIMYLFYVFLHTFAVYFLLYFLLPRYLEKGKQFLFILFLFLCIVGASFSILGSYYFSAWLIGVDINYFCNFQSDNTYYEVFRIMTTNIIPHTAGALLLGLSIKLVKKWNHTQQRQQVLEKEKLETELKFLKYQFNPHFLFNTINSIFFLIHKDPGMASSALGKFSELLRYQLYDCNETQISLANEITYLKNFVALEKLRKKADLRVQLEIEEEGKGYLGIAPFILMTFVENAFKHVSKHRDNANWINIKLYFKTERTLVFEVTNSTSGDRAEQNEVIHYGGIGLKNVKRRLALIYPQQHQLEIKNESKHFAVKLVIQLSELPARVDEPETKADLVTNRLV